jgi:hypothetical protein
MMSAHRTPPDAMVDAVVVTHDSGATLSECIARLLAVPALSACVIVDNASRDGGPEAVLAAHQAHASPRLSLLRNTQNRGFAVACNQGARAGSAPWVAFVNPDCFVDIDTFARMIAAATATRLRSPARKAGMLGADVRDAQGVPEPAARRYAPTLSRVFVQALGLSRWWPQHGLYVAHDAHSQAQITEVEACSGALMLLPRALFESLGGFDEAYPLHGEDLDLCARVRAAGHSVVAVNDARAIHIKGTSSQVRPLYVAWCKHRGLARYLHRHAAHGSGWRHALIALGVWSRFTLSLPWLCWRALRAARPLR